MRVVIGEDSLIAREGIVRLLDDADVEVAGVAADLDGIMRAVASYSPDCAILDIRMPPTGRDEGIVAAQRIRAEHPDVAVLVLSQYLEPGYAMRLLEEHPERTGYLLKERVTATAVLVDALERLVAGETVIDSAIVSRLLARRRTADPLGELSEREREVLGLVAEGLSNAAIGTRLFITERTVEAHVKQIFQKLRIEQVPSTNRRVLAVLAYLRSDGAAAAS